MNKLTEEQLKEYLSNPNLHDSKVRKWCNIPEDRYYTVSVWPENLAGIVRVDNNRFRTVKNTKISKSSQ